MREFPTGSRPRKSVLLTRNAILDAAGGLFAERGFGSVSSKSVCEASGVNGAAVNYHFGGKERLYEEVLSEARRRIMAAENWSGILSSEGVPEEKLCIFLKQLFRLATEPSQAWCFKIYLRELVCPSLFAGDIPLLPTAGKVQALIHEITGLPLDSTRLRMATVLTLMPCICLIVCPATLQESMYLLQNTHPESLSEDVVLYSLGGLQAIRTGI